MGRPNRKLIKQTGSKHLYERATFFRRLADGAADARFAAKLQALVAEHEGKTTRAETSATPAAENSTVE